MRNIYIFAMIITYLPLSLKGQDKPILSNLDLDKLLGYSCGFHELGQAYQDAQKSNSKAGNYLNERLGGNNLTHSILTNNLAELTHLDLKLNAKTGIQQIVRNARICDHQDVVSVKNIKEDEKEVLGEIQIFKENIIKTRLLYRFDKINKKVLHLAVAKTGSNLLSEGYTVFDETYSGKVNDRKIFKVDIGSIEQNIFKNAFFEFSIKLPEDYEVVNEKDMESIKNKNKEIIKELEKKKSEVEHKTIHLLIRKNKQGEADHTSLTIMTMTNHDTFKIKKAMDYAQYLKKGMSFMPFMKFKGEPEDVKVNNKTMANLKLLVKTEDLPEAHQEYFITMKYGKAVAIIINYSDAKHRDKLINIVKTFEIK